MACCWPKDLEKKDEESASQETVDAKPKDNVPQQNGSNGPQQVNVEYD